MSYIVERKPDVFEEVGAPTWRVDAGTLAFYDEHDDLGCRLRTGTVDYRSSIGRLMAMFSSREPFNDDPEPWVNENDERTDRNPQLVGHGAFMPVMAHSPRPEYDRPQHNPTNPILTEFRKLHEATGNDLWTDAYLSWSDLIEEEWTTEDEYFHAFKVLGKIVALGK